MGGVSAGAFIPGVSGVKDSPTGTFATYGSQAAAWSGYTAYFSDVGIGGAFLYSDGIRWRPVNGSVVLKNTVSPVTNNAAPKIVMDYATILGGLIGDGDILQVDMFKERSGGTSDTDTTDFLLGTVNTTLGTSLGVSTGVLTTTTIQAALQYRFMKQSATTLKNISIPGGIGLGGSTSAIVAAVTVPNMNTQTTYLQVSSDLTTAGGEVVTLRGYTVTWICGS